MAWLDFIRQHGRLGLFLFLLLVILSSAYASTTAYTAEETEDLFGHELDQEEERLLRLINDYRWQQHLPALRISPRLCQAAAWMSLDMARNRYMDHTDSLKRSPWERMAHFGYRHETDKGENIASGSMTAKTIFELWNGSPMHHANLVNKGYRVVGLARVYLPDSEYHWYWTAVFSGFDDMRKPLTSVLDYHGRNITVSSNTGNLFGLCDELLPLSSRDTEPQRFAWEIGKAATTAWVAYEFKESRTCSGVGVYWAVDAAPNGKCRLPASWRVLYRDGTQWKPVEAAGAYGVQADVMNRVAFTPVTTTALRLEVSLPAGAIAGLHEWQIEEKDQPRSIWLENLSLTPITCGSDRPRRLRAVNGNPLSLRGVCYRHGVGTHADSAVAIDTRGKATRFEALVGIDDAVPRDWKGTVSVTVWGDGKKLQQLPRLTRQAAPQPISVDLAGVKQLLVEIDHDADQGWDHVDLVNARVLLPQDVTEFPVTRQPRFPVGELYLSASFTGDRLRAVCDGLQPDRSDDWSTPRFTWGEHKGTAEWVAYEFDKPRTVSGCEVFWCEDTGSLRTPASWRICYQDGDAWKPVTPRTEPGVTPNCYNYVGFDPVTTTGLKIEAQLRDKQTAGILEWRLEDDAPEKVVWLDSLNLSHMTSGHPRPQRGKSLDRNPLSIWGKVYQHGVGTHAVSILRIDLKRAVRRFKTTVGLDDELPTSQHSKVRFTVWGDGKLLADSDILFRMSMPVELNVPVAGMRYLTLQAEDGGDGNAWDHADWADARFILEPGTRERPEAVPTPTTCPLVAAPDRAISASFIEQKPLAVCDLLYPDAKHRDVPRFTWWPHKGTTEWIAYTFPTPRTIDGTGVYWFDDSKTGGQCRPPVSWQLFYLDGDEWKPVQTKEPYGVDKFTFNIFHFTPVTSTSFKLEARLGENVSAGILEWIVE